MRGSDVVDLLAELLPRWLVRLILAGVLAVGALFGSTAVIEWYIADKAAGYTEYWTPVFEEVVANLLPSPPAV